MHGKSPGALEPYVIARMVMQHEKRVGIARGAVTQSMRLIQRSRTPGQFTRCNHEAVDVSIPSQSEMYQRRNDPRRAVTVLHESLLRTGGMRKKVIPVR